MPELTLDCDTEDLTHFQFCIFVGKVQSPARYAFEDVDVAVVCELRNSAGTDGIVRSSGGL